MAHHQRHAKATVLNIYDQLSISYQPASGQLPAMGPSLAPHEIAALERQVEGYLSRGKALSIAAGLEPHAGR